MVTPILTPIIVGEVYKEWRKSILENTVDMGDLRKDDKCLQKSNPEYYKHVVFDRNEGMYNSLRNLKGTTVELLGRGTWLVFTIYGIKPTIKEKVG